MQRTGTMQRRRRQTLHGRAIYTASQKQLCQSTLFHNFDKCWPSVKILSLLFSPQNLQQNLCHSAHHIYLNVSVFLDIQWRSFLTHCVYHIVQGHGVAQLGQHSMISVRQINSRTDRVIVL